MVMNSVCDPLGPRSCFNDKRPETWVRVISGLPGIMGTA